MDLKIIIRNWEFSDAENLARAINNKSILDNLRDGLPYPYTVNDAKEYINITLNAEKDSQYPWAICADNKAIGSVTAFRKDNIHNRTAEIGYYISQEYWGKGIGTIALKMACDYIFNNTDIVRIFAEPFSNNISSCRILEKAGFVCEGILHKNAFKNNKIIDMKMYAIVK